MMFGYRARTDTVELTIEQGDQYQHCTSITGWDSHGDGDREVCDLSLLFGRVEADGRTQS